MLQKQRMICTSTYRCALYILTAPFIDSPSMVGVKEGCGCYDWRIEKVQYEDAFDMRGWRSKMKYYRGLDTERYNFYRIPKVLVTDRRFRKLSSDSKMLYGIMLDRMTLYSKKNNWIDQDDHVPVFDIRSDLKIFPSTALVLINFSILWILFLFLSGFSRSSSPCLQKSCINKYNLLAPAQSVFFRSSHNFPVLSKASGFSVYCIPIPMPFPLPEK